MKSLRNSVIRIPSETEIPVSVKIRDTNGNLLDLKNVKGEGILGQGNDRREDYKKVELGIEKDRVTIYFPPMTPGEYRLKMVLKRNKLSIRLLELRIIVIGDYVINPSSRKYGYER